MKKKPKTSGQVKKMRDLEGPTSICPVTNTLYSFVLLETKYWKLKNVIS